MLVRFKGKDPRAGQEINLAPAAAKRYIADGLASAVKDAGDEADTAAARKAETAERSHAGSPAPAPAAKKAGRGR